MPKKSAVKPRRRPQSALLQAINPTPTPPPAKKSKKKRVAVGVGDLVALESPISHMTGSVGEIVQILDQNRTVIKAMGTRYDAYEGTQWVALTYQPSGTTNDGDDLADCRIWIRRVIYARNPEPPKEPKPKKVTVLEGTDALLAELASPDPVGKNTQVVYIPDSEEPQP